MDVAIEPNDEQRTLWNGAKGRVWVEAQAVLDRMFAPLQDALVQGIPVGSGSRVLDVGCGTGGTTLAVARRLGAGGACTGIDISEPMLAAARARAERDGAPADFIRADAQTYAFEPARFDTILSRIGVMFFADPVRAFANLRRAAKDDAALRFVAWRSPEENAFMTTAERAAAPLLPDIVLRRAGPAPAAGQFAFADRRRVRRILAESGWAGIDIRPVDLACSFPESELVTCLTRLGPLGEILHEVDAPTRAQVIETVRAAFDPYVHGAEVRFAAACWLVGAKNA